MVGFTEWPSSLLEAVLRHKQPITVLIVSKCAPQRKNYKLKPIPEVVKWHTLYKYNYFRYLPTRKHSVRSWFECPLRNPPFEKLLLPTHEFQVRERWSHKQVQIFFGRQGGGMSEKGYRKWSFWVWNRVEGSTSPQKIVNSIPLGLLWL